MITGLKIAEMSQRQGGGAICTKNGSYCEKEKKVGEGGGGGGGQGRCERRSEAFCENSKGGGGRVEGGGGGGVRVDVNGEVKLL